MRSGHIVAPNGDIVAEVAQFTIYPMYAVAQLNAAVIYEHPEDFLTYNQKIVWFDGTETLPGVVEDHDPNAAPALSPFVAPEQEVVLPRETDANGGLDAEMYDI